MNEIPYGRQKIEEEDIEAVVEVLKGNFLTQGPAVAEFESSMSAFLAGISGTSNPIYTTAVNNGTSALHLACLALGVKPGDRVLVTPNTFVASANAIRYCGGEVEFVDISPDTLCMDLDLLEEQLERAPHAYQGVVIVDFAGYPADLKRLRKIADRYGIWILEDACHAIGARRRDIEFDARGWYGAGDGMYADLAVFSFHPVKHVATGEGGMVVTRSSQLNEKLKLYRTHGITKDPSKMARQDGGWFYEMQELGHNFRISDILCALGASQMRRLEKNLLARRGIAERYQVALQNLPLELPRDSREIQHAYHLYVVKTPVRKALYDHLFSKKIFAQVHYIPVHQQPYYVNRYGRQHLPNCDRYYENCLSIPMYHSLSAEDQDRVIEEIKMFFLDSQSVHTR